MNDNHQDQGQQADTKATNQARQGLKRAEMGEKAGARQVERVTTEDPAAAEAVKQETSDGPGGRGLSR